MADYYDKDKFTGNRNTSGGGYQPPPKRPYQTPPPKNRIIPAGTAGR